MNKRSRIRGRLAWCVALMGTWVAPATVTLFPTTALAQGGLDAAVVSASPLSPADKTQVEKYVQDRLPDLKGGGTDPAKDAVAVKKARTELTAPLLMEKVSVPFRQEYSRLLIQAKLADLCKDKNDIVAINALRLAGETAASEMLALITEQLTDQRTSVRYAAGYAAQRLFEQCAAPNHSLAVTMDSLVDTVGKLSTRLGKEKEPLVSDILLRSLLSASQLNKEKSEPVRAAAIKAMSQGLGAILKDAKLADKIALGSAIGIASELRNIIPNRAAQWTSDERKDVMGLAADMVTWAAKRVVAKELAGKDDRKTASSIVRLAEALLNETQKAEGIVAAKPIALANFFEQDDNAGDARFLAAFDELITDQLVKKPFEFKAERFKYK